MKKFIIAVAALCLTSTLSAQKFMPAFDRFSGKKVSYLYLVDGTEVTGTIDDLDRKKGLIEEVTIKPENGKKKSYKAEEIKSMYLVPSGWDKMGKFDDFMGDPRQWKSIDADKDILGKGYVYFELVQVQIKKKVLPLLMQCVNPSFNSQHKVFHDPYAQESIGLGVAGFTLVGGDDKSYYILKKGETIAVKYKKKDYEEGFDTLFGSCDAFVNKVGKNIYWMDIEKHIFEYNQICE
jgi:hypothetical protein